MKTNFKLLLARSALLTSFIALPLLPLARNSVSSAPQNLPQGVTRVPVVFTGGHETEGVDRGRPVILIAAALGVPPEVFREAFSRVRPAGPGRGGPTPDEARQNKEALMKVLRRYGITNERLDEVSNFYRYPPGRGHIWRNTPAQADALVKNGVVIGYEITDGGAGYSSLPSVSVPGVKGARAQVKLEFNKDLDSNGSVSSVTVAKNGEGNRQKR